MAHYVAVIHKDEASCFGVSFPDLPGLISAGDTLEEAMHNAADALTYHVELLRNFGDPIPNPRSLDALVSAGETEGATAVTPIPLLARSGRNQRINLSIDSGLLETIDQWAGKFGESRSAFLAEAARKRITDNL